MTNNICKKVGPVEFILNFKVFYLFFFFFDAEKGEQCKRRVSQESTRVEMAVSVVKTGSKYQLDADQVS